MHKNKRIYFVLIAVPLIAASLFFTRPAMADTVTAEGATLRILIVPGHEPDYGGAEFGRLKERDLVVELGRNLKELLEADGAYDVFMTRDEEGWNPVLEDYFDNNWDEIISWEKDARKRMAHLISIGSTTRAVPTIDHIQVETDVATRLYGVTKWSNENDIDLMVHIHFNDDPLHSSRVPGKFSGFALYVPPKQYSNGVESRFIADALFERFAMYNPVSDWKQESGGIIEAPQLIALGVNNTSLSTSVLIEYDYVYVPRLKEPRIRSLVLKELANETYLGLQDFFGKETSVAPGSRGTSILPYLWLGPVTGTSTVTDIYALQTALSAMGEYPPAGKTKNDCPRSGVFGPCTRAALRAFQKSHGIGDEAGVAGEKTLSILQGDL